MTGRSNGWLKRAPAQELCAKTSGKPAICLLLFVFSVQLDEQRHNSWLNISPGVASSPQCVTQAYEIHSHEPSRLTKRVKCRSSPRVQRHLSVLSGLRLRARENSS